jgi:DNA-binding winged helix-turn-helix (wHTH) protein/TolB-like protein
VTFGEFEVDPSVGELKRNGARVRLQDLPFRMLVMLVERPGVVVTREDLRAALWGAGTFVDAEAGLNTAVAKLREALGDSAESPRFIETIPKRGYRFVAPVTNAGVPKVAEEPVSGPRQTRSRFFWVKVGVFLGAMFVLGLMTYLWLHPSRVITIAVMRFHNETGEPANDALANELTDATVVALAKNDRYAVIGNSPLLRTDRMFADVQKVGQSLSARYVVLGQLQRGDRGLVVRAHFVRVSDQTHLWANAIDLGSASAPEEAVTSAVSNGITAGLQRERDRR